MVVVFIPALEVAFPIFARDLLQAQDVGVIGGGLVEVGLACLDKSESHDAHGNLLPFRVCSAFTGNGGNGNRGKKGKVALRPPAGWVAGKEVWQLPGTGGWVDKGGCGRSA